MSVLVVVQLVIRKLPEAKDGTRSVNIEADAKASVKSRAPGRGVTTIPSITKVVTNHDLRSA